MNTLARPLSALALAAGLAVAPAAQAALMTQDATFIYSATTDVVDAGGQAIHSRQDTLQFQLFDPSWGQLTAARWELVSALGTDGHATVWGNGQYATGATLNIGIGGVTRNADGSGLRGAPGLFLGAEGQQSASCVVPVETWTCDIDLSFSVTADGALDATDLAALTGTGSFEQGLHSVIFVNAYPDALTSMLSWGSYVWGDYADRHEAGTLRLVYEYELPNRGEVPEPASAALVLLALGAMPLARRSKAQAAGAKLSARAIGQ